MSLPLEDTSVALLTASSVAVSVSVYVVVTLKSVPPALVVDDDALMLVVLVDSVLIVMVGKAAVVALPLPASPSVVVSFAVSVEAVVVVVPPPVVATTSSLVSLWVPESFVADAFVGGAVEAYAAVEEEEKEVGSVVSFVGSSADVDNVVVVIGPTPSLVVALLPELPASVALLTNVSNVEAFVAIFSAEVVVFGWVSVTFDDGSFGAVLKVVANDVDGGVVSVSGSVAFVSASAVEDEETFVWVVAAASLVFVLSNVVASDVSSVAVSEPSVSVVLLASTSDSVAVVLPVTL